MICSNPGLMQRLRVAALLLLLALVPGLFVGGAQPVAVGLVPAPWDKLAHLGLFALFALLAGTAGGLLRLRGAALLWLGFAVALLLGVLDEWHQATLPGRAAGWDDLAADALGAAAGTWLLARLGLARCAGR